MKGVSYEIVKKLLFRINLVRVRLIVSVMVFSMQVSIRGYSVN